ncbi:MAG: hypothetical protein JXR70_03095 [Spirochaetales bacterium]|nr:hypothetical protein [Spirochaetales bacterium]
MNILNCVKTKSFRLYNSIKYYIQLDYNENDSLESIFEKYRGALELMKGKNIQILFEKIFCPLSSYHVVIARRESLFVEMNMDIPPLSFIEGKSVDNNIAGVLFCGVICLSDDVSVSYYKKYGKTLGSVYESPFFRYLYLYGLQAKKGSDGKINYPQFKELFQEIGNIIVENGFLPKDILRTWIYLDDINNNYGSFNQARREYFEENNIQYSAHDNELPASTCIGGSSFDSSILINLVCVDKKTASPKIKRIYNQFQNEAEGEAYLFRPTFSRALLVEEAEFSELQVSGTASINEKGETVFLQQPYEQIRKTILNVADLLKQAKHDFSDFCEATCFFKKPEYYNDYLEVLKELNITGLSGTCVIGDVCRDDLLFEFDGVSIKKRENHRP